MKYSVIQCSNGNFQINAEDENINTAKVNYFGTCQNLQNTTDVYTGSVAIVDETFAIYSDGGGIYKATISHDRPQPEPEKQGE